jgi:hypothetical protein
MAAIATWLVADRLLLQALNQLAWPMLQALACFPRSDHRMLNRLAAQLILGAVPLVVACLVVLLGPAWLLLGALRETCEVCSRPIEPWQRRGWLVEPDGSSTYWHSSCRRPGLARRSLLERLAMLFCYFDSHYDEPVHIRYEVGTGTYALLRCTRCGSERSLQGAEARAWLKANPR